MGVIVPLRSSGETINAQEYMILGDGDGEGIIEKKFFCPVSRTHITTSENGAFKHLNNCRAIAPFKQVFRCIFNPSHFYLTEELCQKHMDEFCPNKISTNGDDRIQRMGNKPWLMDSTHNQFYNNIDIILKIYFPDKFIYEKYHNNKKFYEKEENAIKGVKANEMKQRIKREEEIQEKKKEDEKNAPPKRKGFIETTEYPIYDILLAEKISLEERFEKSIQNIFAEKGRKINELKKNISVMNSEIDEEKKIVEEKEHLIKNLPKLLEEQSRLEQLLSQKTFDYDEALKQNEQALENLPIRFNSDPETVKNDIELYKKRLTDEFDTKNRSLIEEIRQQKNVFVEKQEDLKTLIKVNDSLKANNELWEKKIEQINLDIKAQREVGKN